MKSKPANIDPQELLKFDGLAAEWWRSDGKFKGLHDINPIRLAYIRQRVDLHGKRVLDVGCGGGILSEAMAGVGARVTGIDAGREPLAVARHHAVQSGHVIEYRQSTVEALAVQQPDHYEVVTCLELLEHVPDPSLVVSACGRLVKPGGDVFFATLNKTVKSFLLAIIAAEYILGVVAKGTHRWRRFIRPQDLVHWAEAAGLTVRDLTGLYYNPLLKRQYLRRDASVNYLMHFVKG